MEWDKLGSYEKELNAYNVPSELLSNMSTANLVKTCLDYPELRLIFTRNSLQLGYDYLKTIFNGFSELESRKDAGKELLKVYHLMDPNKIQDLSDPIAKGNFTFSFIYIELILSQPAIIQNFDLDDKKDLVTIVLKNYKSKQTLVSEYSEIDKITPSLILGRILLTSKTISFLELLKKNKNINNFLINSIPSDTSIFDTFIGEAQKITIVE